MPTNTATLPGKILVVDDIPANRVAMRRLLSKLDCTLIEAGSGNAALSACLDHEFALILLDVQMPEMDGLKWRRCSARTKPPHTRPSFLSPQH